MEVSVSQQLYVFLAMTLCGACSGAIFDIFRIIRKTFGSNTLTTSLGDILFWLLISIGMFFTLFYVSNGEIRWHEGIGVVLGGVIYFLALSKIFITLTGAILRFFIKIFLTIFKIILTPLVFLYKMIKKPLYWAFRKLRHAFVLTTRKSTGLYASLCRSVKKLKLIMKKS